MAARRRKLDFRSYAIRPARHKQNLQAHHGRFLRSAQDNASQCKRNDFQAVVFCLVKLLFWNSNQRFGNNRSSRSYFHQEESVLTSSRREIILGLAPSLPEVSTLPLTFFPPGKNCERFIRKEQSIAKTNGKTRENNSKIHLQLEKCPRNAWRRRSVFFYYSLCANSTGILVRDYTG